MRTSHRLLLRLYHDARYSFEAVCVEYVDRGAAGDRSSARGRDIAELDRDYMVIESPQGRSYIPYHRITSIRYRGILLWDRATGEHQLPE
ncbi:MAG: DUF504 domain-containing protein [Methanomicrobiaceae archaeon]|nr:DUF504 domain-containing protein [Methanomicrobiaceae archaeon]